MTSEEREDRVRLLLERGRLDWRELDLKHQMLLIRYIGGAASIEDIFDHARAHPELWRRRFPDNSDGAR